VVSLNMRRQAILKILETTIQGTPLTIDALSHMLNVSQRTIRYDLNCIEDELKDKGFLLHKKSHKGVWIESDDLKKNHFMSEEECQYEYIFSKEERTQASVVYILDTEEAISIKQLADNLRVSRSTVITDLDNVRELLKKYQLELCSKQGCGIWIEGSELCIRKILIDIFSLHIHDVGNICLWEEKDISEIVLFCKYVKELPIKKFATIFIDILKKENLLYDDFSINYLVIAGSIQLKRLAIGKQVEEISNIEMNDHSSQFLCQIAKRIAEKLSLYNEYFFEEPEIKYIIWQLLNSKISFFSQLNEQEKSTMKLQAINMAEIFIKNCQTWLGNIYSDDEELLYGLAMHLQPVIQRAKYGIKLINPMLPQIQKKYAKLFTITKKAIAEIEQKLGTELSEDEIGYLTIYLGAAIERKKARLLKKMRVILVCENGMGTSQLLSIMLKNRMPYLEIQQIVSVHDLNQQNLNELDLIISTISLEIQENIAILHVSPILSEAEIQVIEKQIRYLYDKKLNIDSNEKIMKSLKEVLLPATIALNVEAKDWESAIAAAGKPLVDIGAVENRYIDNMIECVRQLGPYIVIAPGIAMPHARPENGVKRVCMSMVRLQTPIKFGNLRNDPVELVFALGAVNSESHYRILSNLWAMLSTPSAVTVLRKSNDRTQIFDVIKTYSC